ncbi:MAG TPA: methyltransferase domain-containing protein [Thermoplasmata archaeon]|nr:methyltransferase domain-containing protein [Thermoplasmata archaeon]
MRLLVELSGEQPALARAEVLAALEASGKGHKVLLAEERLLAVETDVDPAWLGRRLALAHFVDELLAWGEFEDVLPAAKALDFGSRSFRVRVNSLKSCHNKVEMEKRLGDLVTGTVDLAAPDEEVRLIEGERHYLCRRAASIDRRSFEARKVGERAFVQPISLHPRLARALVNLSRVRDGGTLLDPFCGTGGILLEAGLIGAKAIGGDVRADMITGTRATLRQFGIDAHLLAADVGDMPEKVGPVDAVAMDPPYGRATSTKGEAIPSLFARGIDVAARVLRPGGHLAIIVPDLALAVPEGGLEIVETYEYRVHKSLTRHFVLMARR